MGGNSFKCQCGGPVIIISERGRSVIMKVKCGRSVIINKKRGRLVICKIQCTCYWRTSSAIVNNLRRAICSTQN